MISTATYLVVCLVAVSLFTIIAIGESRADESEAPEDFGEIE